MGNSITKLSMLVPVYNEEECLALLYNRLKQVLNTIGFDYEILFVNDGSNDQSLEIIKNFYILDRHVAYLDLSRNYGKETAMAAGIDHISGDALCIIDADLQDPPELIADMINEILNGYDDVYAQRISREGESLMKKISSKLYYRILTSISEIPIQKDTGDYRMFSKKAIDALREMKEHQRNMKGLFSYVGFKKSRYFLTETRE
jgi:glycosyltransferase involved in cell wall biosynthesis